MTSSQVPALRASSNHEIVSRKRRKIFLRVYAMTGNKLYAAQSAGYPNCTHINRFLKTDTDFKRAFDEAQDAAADALEAEVIRRGKDGVLKAVYHKGEVVGHEIVYSDPLLLAAMKAAKPEKYSEKSQKEINHKHTGVVGVALLPSKFMTVEDWEKQNATGLPLQLPTPSIDAEFTPVPAAEEAEVREKVVEQAKNLEDELANL